MQKIVHLVVAIGVFIFGYKAWAGILRSDIESRPHQLEIVVNESAWFDYSSPENFEEAYSVVVKRGAIKLEILELSIADPIYEQFMLFSNDPVDSLINSIVSETVPCAAIEFSWVDGRTERYLSYGLSLYDLNEKMVYTIPDLSSFSLFHELLVKSCEKILGPDNLR